MSEKRTYKLASDQVRAHCIDEIARAPLGKVVIVQDPTRTLDQNAKFHAMCSDVAKSGVLWMGRQLSAAQWKVMFVSGHAIATGVGADILPGLEGEFVNVRESTARMSKKRGASLIEYVLAWCAENEILLPSYGGDCDANYVQDGLRGAGVREADSTSLPAYRG